MKAKTLRAVRTTFRALRNRNFRLFFAGQLISQAGTWLTRAIEALTDEGRARTLVDAIDLLNALADWRADDRAGTGARR